MIDVTDGHRDKKTNPAQRAKSVKITWGGDITYHTDSATTRLRGRFSENAIIKQKDLSLASNALNFLYSTILIENVGGITMMFYIYLEKFSLHLSCSLQREILMHHLPAFR